MYTVVTLNPLDNNNKRLLLCFFSIQDSEDSFPFLRGKVLVQDALHTFHLCVRGHFNNERAEIRTLPLAIKVVC